MVVRWDIVVFRQTDDSLVFKFRLKVFIRFWVIVKNASRMNMSAQHSVGAKTVRMHRVVLDRSRTVRYGKPVLDQRCTVLCTAK